MSFTKYSEDIASDFLQTVMVVDDKADFKDEFEQAEKIIGDVKAGDALKKEIEVEEEKTTALDTERLNAKKIIDSFAADGIVCSVFKPSTKETELVTRITKFANSVDVVVLDWNLNNDNGKTSTQIINNLLPTNSTPRLRLIIIYTGENKTTIVDDLLSEIKSKVSSSFDNYDGKNSLKIGHTLISIFTKPGIQSEFSIEPENLPNIVIKEFAKIYSGLVPNAALKSISILREHTHNLLETLNSSLDPPYLSHRALLPQPEDSEQHLIEIISLEIQSLLKNYNAHSPLMIEHIKDWLDEFDKISLHSLELNETEPFTEIKIPDPLSNEIVLKWLEIGLEKSLIPKTITNKNERNTFSNNCHVNLTKVFCKDSQNAAQLDKEFALKTSLKSYYDGQKPKLFLGTIVRFNKEKDNAEYWLCVQPKCDCVRIEKSREFHFLKLIKSENHFDFIIKDFNNYLSLKVDYSLFQSMHKKFKASDGVIISEKDTNGMFYFKISDGGNIYYWIGELKDVFSQRIVNNLGAYMSRVGLDESEWLRRS